MGVSLLLCWYTPLKFPYGVKFSLNFWNLGQNVTRLYIPTPPPWKGFYLYELRYLWFIWSVALVCVALIGVWLDMIGYKKPSWIEGYWGLSSMLTMDFKSLVSTNFTISAMLQILFCYLLYEHDNLLIFGYWVNILLVTILLLCRITVSTKYIFKIILFFI